MELTSSLAISPSEDREGRWTLAGGLNHARRDVERRSGRSNLPWTRDLGRSFRKAIPDLEC